MCIANFNGFDMDRALKVEKETQVEQLATWNELTFLNGWKVESY
jgi:hypothetical protein